VSYLSNHRKTRCDGHPLSSLPTTRSAPRTLKLLSPILPVDIFNDVFVHIVSVHGAASTVPGCLRKVSRAFEEPFVLYVTRVYFNHLDRECT